MGELPLQFVIILFNSDSAGDDPNSLPCRVRWLARYNFSGSIPPKFERKLRRYKQRFGKIDKDENLL